MALEFDSPSHTYTLDGSRVPSVTEVLDRYLDFDGIPLAQLEAARVRGQMVHEAANLLVREELDWASLDDSLVPYLEGAKRFLDESGITVIASELRVASRKLNVAGTLDVFGHWQGSECILDWKATAAMPVTVGPQCAAYDALYREEHGGRAKRRFCVQLKRGDYRVKELKDARDFNIFVSCLNTFRYFGSKQHEE